MREVVIVSRAVESWEILGVLDALEPIVEAPVGVATGRILRIGIGAPPLRLLMRAR